MRFEVDFPTTGLPDDRVLVDVEHRVPGLGEYFFNGTRWNKVCINFSNPYHTATLKPKEVWLPCTPEDAFMKMMNPESRVIRVKSSLEILSNVQDIRRDNLTTIYRCPLQEVRRRLDFRLTNLEVLQTKEPS